MLWKRVVTAAVLLPLLILAILSAKGRPGGWPFLLVCGAAAAMGAAELFRMSFRDARTISAGVLLATLIFLAASLLPWPLVFPAALLCVLLAVLHPLPGSADPLEKARAAAMLSLGAVYVGGMLAMYPRTLSLPRGEHWVLLGILSVSSGDTLAYFTGKAVGRTRLAPAISPNKTVEGAVGGLLGSVACAVLYAHGFLPSVPAWYAGAAGGAVGLSGQAGDLFESLLKRAAGVKDSGALLPGHGGVLDRTDAILAAGPVLFLLAFLSPLAGAGG
ncbi:MAG: phosphatidate cytidylyltransferase [Verrucomicrobiota bacterium]